MEFLLVAIAIAAAYFLGRWQKNKRLRPIEPSTDQLTPLSFSYEATARTRSYDPNKPRFDGMARPEYRIEYADEDGSITKRDIYVDRINDRTAYYLLECWCFLREEKRTFRSDRILSVRNIETNRQIKDIRAHMSR